MRRLACKGDEEGTSEVDDARTEKIMRWSLKDEAGLKHRCLMEVPCDCASMCKKEMQRQGGNKTPETLTMKST